jgi:hypothetical protein
MSFGLDKSIYWNSPVVTTDNYNTSKDYWSNNTWNEVFNTSTLGYSWNEFRALSLYETKSNSLIP